MAGHDPLTATILVVALMAVVLVGMFVFLRLLRAGFFHRRREAKTEEEVQADRVYNALVTSEAISRELGDKGFQSPQAAALLQDAQRAYFGGSGDEAETLSTQARSILMDALHRDHQDDAPTLEEEIPESKPVLGKEYPKHYMEAKFLLGVIEGRVKRTKKASKKGTKARELWEKAGSSYAEENYTEALGLALQCRRLLEGKAPRKERPPPKCPECGTGLAKDDEFCGKCGAALKVTARCRGCGAPLEAEDLFCRKCGAAVEVTPPAA